MNTLLFLSALSLQVSVTAHQQTPDKTTHPQVAHSAAPSVKPHLFGSGVKGTPRVLGIHGIQTIPAGKFNVADFKPYSKMVETVQAGLNNRRGFASSPTALILYDTTGSWSWIGNLYSIQLSNLLSHFGVTVTREGVQSYQAGDLAKYGSAYYLGTTYASPLPAAFLTDFYANTNPFCWMGYNLWEVAWTPDFSAWNPSFTYKFGFQFASLDSTGYPYVSYKGASLTKQQYDPMQGNTLITDSTLASVLATSSNGTTTAPYITKGANLWYVADNPMEYVAYNRGDDRMLAFDDILNDVTGAPSTSKNAVLRIEDVSAIADSASLRGIADTLFAQNIPYVVSVIPDYKDPLGANSANGKAQEIKMQNSKTFIADLKYMQSKGAQLIMHGISHQYSNVRNPYDGVSADDVEFFRVSIDPNTGNLVNVGPLTEDSTTWVTSRIASGMSMFTSAGFAKPTGWNSPHYYATPTDYTVFGTTFGFSMDRGLTYVLDGSNNLQMLIGYAPWVIKDNYGVRRIPETIGYYDPTGSSGKVNNPIDIIGYAQQMQCVRGGWAGCYYHWYLGTTALQQLVSGVKALGYTFVNPTGTTN